MSFLSEMLALSCTFQFLLNLVQRDQRRNCVKALRSKVRVSGCRTARHVNSLLQIRESALRVALSGSPAVLGR